MIQRSEPTLLIYEGEIQKAIAILCCCACPAISVYGLTSDNEKVSLGPLATCRLDITTPKIVVIWWEYDTSIPDYDIVNSINILIDGTYGVIGDNSTP